MNTQGTSGRSVTVGLPEYELIGKDGRKQYFTFKSAQAAASFAKELWPDQEQDPDRTGKGWDIQVVP